MLLALYIITGMIFGSFLNVVIQRSPRAESLINPRSICPQCRERLLIHDLIPVIGYLLLGGRCRFCRAKISLRYPIVEMLSAAGFAVSFIRYGTSVWMLAGCIFLSILIVSTFTDLETGIIPDRVTYFGIVSGFALSFLTVGWLSSLTGSLVFGGFLFLAAFLSGGGMGGGDVKLGAAIGAFTGFKMALMVMVLASFLGGTWALVLLIMGKAGLKTRIKFGPFLALAALVVWAFGQKITVLIFQMPV